MLSLSPHILVFLVIQNVHSNPNVETASKASQSQMWLVLSFSGSPELGNVKFVFGPLSQIQGPLTDKHQLVHFGTSQVFESGICVHVCV